MTTTTNIGKVYRVHFECKAHLPIGSTLYVNLLKDANTSTNLVEMITSPSDYPIWRTRRPVVITDVGGGGGSMNDTTTVLYRYCAMSHAVGGAGGGGGDKLERSMHSNKSMVSLISAGTSMVANRDAIDREFGPGAVVEVEDPWETKGHRDLLVTQSSETSLNGVESAQNSTVGSFSGNDEGVMAPTRLPFRFRIAQSTEEVRDEWNNRDDETFRLYRQSLEDRGVGDDTDLTESDGDEQREFSRSEEVQNDDKSGQAVRGSLYLVCFHLPIKVGVSIKEDGLLEWCIEWNESLLAKTTERSQDILDTYSVHWIGTATLPEKPSGNSEYSEEELEPLHKMLQQMNCTAIFLPNVIRKAHYYGMCKQVLWPAFHNIDLLDLSEAGFDQVALDLAKDSIISDWDQSGLDQWWSAYKQVNRIFCEKVCSLVTQPDSIIWVHDYHLSLLPKYIHMQEVVTYGTRRSKMVFFLHIPFPTSQIFRELECGEAILEGMLHSSVIGFHAFDHARHFLHSAKRIMGCDYDTLTGGLIGVQVDGGKRTVVVDISNVSIEPYTTSMNLKDPKVHEDAATIKANHQHRHIIAGVDVAQRLSGVALKLLAFEKLLTEYTVWQNKVVMIQRMIIPNSRRSDEIATLNQVRGLVSRIKASFGDHVLDYTEHYGSSLPIKERLSIWLASSCFMNTCVREGLNLHPMEYIFTRKEPIEPGIVIASEFSALCSILNGALKVNPFDVQMTASCIDKALSMENTERLGRRHRDIGFVGSCPSSKWTKNVLRDLREVTLLNYQRDTLNDAAMLDKIICTPANPLAIQAAYEKTSKRVIILDFNGTLVKKEPTGKYLKREILGTSGQKPPTKVMQALRKLTSDRRNTVFVVSGDTQENLENAIGHISGLGLAASNGACFSWPSMPGSPHQWYNFEFGDDWAAVKQVALPILSKYTARTNGSTIKLSDASIGWSYYSCDPEWGGLQAAHLLVELEHQLAAFDVRFVTLKGVIEVVPKMMHKGIVVKKILREVASRNNGAGVDFVLCIGDDVSDEKMFSAVYKFKSEENDDYNNVTASPSVKPKSSNISVTNARVMNEVRSLRYQNIDEEDYAFTITVGKKTSTNASDNSSGTTASQYINDASDVEDILVTLAGGDVSQRSMSWDFTENVGVDFFA